MTITSVRVVTTRFLFGICDCMVASDVCMGDFSLLLEILHVCGDMYVQSHMCPGMDCYTSLFLSLNCFDISSKVSQFQIPFHKPS